ncbi:uncharacterized protein LOC114774242 isoform X3 [Denticeps clupeoides]|uniref:uncharacterized protein LOC114774242 isoform X3 n=1 Tax=Denticeps clupeoides TaxID=299321 RepID=UPI0010A40C0B|nr:uncharacterized protein LOC114774242 isoform X3 [Denticeps clupeoides]
MQDRMMMMMVVLSIVPILESGIVTAASKDQSLKGFIFQQKGLPDNLIRIGMGDTVFDKEDLLPLKPCSESAWPSPGHFICCETENEQAAVIWVGDEDPQPEGIVDKKVVVLSTRKLENPLKTIRPPASFRSTAAALDQTGPLRNSAAGHPVLHHQSSLHIYFFIYSGFLVQLVKG